MAVLKTPSPPTVKYNGILSLPFVKRQKLMHFRISEAVSV